MHATGHFSLSCDGPGGTASATASVKVLGVFPLRVEAGRRYLIDAEDNPFLLQGDSAWDLITQLTSQEAEQYLEDRRQKGFNAVVAQLIGHSFLPDPPKNAAGDSPFTSCNISTHVCDFSTANDAYFAHADWVISRAAEKGILVLLAPAYLGFNGGNEGWFQEMQDPVGAATLPAYGQYVGNRYRNFANVLWVDGGDFTPPDEAAKNLVRAVANGVRAADRGAALRTFHGQRHTPALGFWGMSEPWLAVNDIYTDENDVVSMASVEYNRSAMPFFMIENRYENEPLASPTPASAALVRTQAYQAMLSGATGHVMGNFPVWDFATGWPAALNSGAATTLKHLRTLFESRPWWTLQPDLSNSVLIGGIGSMADRAVAARAADGSFAIAYVPAVRTITIDLRQLSGPTITARWCDPNNGLCAAAAGSPFVKSASGPQPQAFLPPGANSGGFNDWVLLLESTP